jgi:hypothetical protein
MDQTRPMFPLTGRRKESPIGMVITIPDGDNSDIHGPASFYI